MNHVDSAAGIVMHCTLCDDQGKPTLAGIRQNIFIAIDRLERAELYDMDPAARKLISMSIATLVRQTEYLHYLKTA